MLVNAKDIQNACTLSITEVRAAMGRSGYEIGRNEITGVDFKGMNANGTFVYEIAGPDPEGDDDITLGNVYLRFQRKSFQSEFQLYGEY